jgi:hypothetical protein
MWQRWSAPLEWLGRLRFGWSGSTRLRVGDVTTNDARGGSDWQRFRTPEPLFDVWGPHPASPWVPFHAVPLFAALDRIPAREIGPAAPPDPTESADPRNRVPALARPGSPPPAFLEPATLTVLDLPGPAAVQTAVWLVGAGAQPVCTFDNWPHPRGVLRAEQTLAEMLRWASTVAPLRARIRPDSPPLWICDAGRLGQRAGSPGDFDNRYFLDDSTLPGPRMLTAAGIRRVVYVTLAAEHLPVMDLEPYFADLLAAGLDVQHADLARPLFEPQPFAELRSGRRVPTSTFRRSSAGGFGTEVPQPSSGGGG